MDVTNNTIVCPHCANVFQHNKVNGVALVELAQSIETRKRMRCRLTLDDLEKKLGGTVYWPIVKKSVLDGYNDLSRDVLTTLGFGTEVE